MIGQERIQAELGPIINGLSSGNSVRPKNILLQGPAGCGKTHLGKSILYSCQEEVRLILPRSDGSIDLDFSNIHAVMIDEIHTMRHFERIYPYMDADSPFFIFCTTDYGELPDPFLTRCLRLTFDPYSLKEIRVILLSYSYGRKYPISNEVANEIASRSKGNPRIAKQLFDRVKGMLGYYRLKPTVENVGIMCKMIGIGPYGYTKEDYRYLEFLEKAERAGLNTIATSLRIDPNTIQKEIEPFLIERGHMRITPRGRIFINGIR